MHYKNGRAAAVGDPVIGKNNGKPFAGVLTSASAGSTTCNGQVRCHSVYEQTPGNSHEASAGLLISTDTDGKTRSFIPYQCCVNLNDLIHAEDALAEIDKAIAAAVPPVEAKA